MKCPACGADVAEGSAYCPQCGARLSGANAGPQSNPAGSQPNTGQPVPAARSAFAGSSGNLGTEQTYQVLPTEGPRFVQPPVSQPADEEEQDLWQGGYSGKDMYETWILYAVITLLLLILSVWAQTAWVSWASVMVVILLWLYGALTLLYRKLSVSYRVTNRRLLHEKGFLWRITDRIELIDIDDVTLKQSPIDRLCGVGTIVITSSDRTDPVLVMPGIKDARRVVDLIDDARLKERRRRAVHLEQV